jgi:hypothetical protein
MYDFLLKGATVIDPANNINSVTDVAIENGRIAETGPDISIRRSRRFFDLSGKILMPGIIDSHLHLSNEAGGPAAFRMVAAAGVVTAVDFAGPLSEIKENLPASGCGLNIAVLEALMPGGNIGDRNPGKAEIDKLAVESMANGALGIKIMGGHFPLTPEATACAVETANDLTGYVAIHAGTTEQGSDVNGFKEAVSLIGGKNAHVAHINSYCRGDLGIPVEEAREILPLLAHSDNIVSESYLGLINGTGGYCRNGAPVSNITRKYLSRGGYSPDEDGLDRAIGDRYAQVNAPCEEAGVNVLLGGREGVAAWRKAGTRLLVSFEVNDPDVLTLCATAKDKKGNFIVDAISTDGGGIVRNVQIEKGLLLVKLGLISIDEFVLKTSCRPSRMYGMLDKGHLGVGADADITVLDFETRRPVLTMGRGSIILLNDFILGTGGTLLITERGRSDGPDINRQVVDVGSGLLYNRSQKKETDR